MLGEYGPRATTTTTTNNNKSDKKRKIVFHALFKHILISL